MGRLNPDRNSKGFPVKSQEYAMGKSDISLLKYIGQFDRKFIVCRLHDKIVLMDQHACDERIKYEKNQKLCKEPFMREPVSLSNRIHMRRRLSKRDVEILGGFGFRFGGSTSVTHVPRLLCLLEEQTKRVLLDMNAAPIINGIPFGLHALLKSKACHEAIRFGDPVDELQFSLLRAQLRECELPWECAHGRPTFYFYEFSASCKDTVPKYQ